MKVKSITFSKLSSYKGEVYLNFNGLNFVLLEGETGSGKSTIFDTISWILFDETIRGIKKSDWLNSSCNSGFGKLVLQDNNNEYTIFRERSKDGKVNLDILQNGISIKKESILETQKELEEKVLKCNFDLFRNSVMFGQNDVLVFTHGTDKERKDIIGKLLGFDEIDRCLSVCRNKMSLLQEEIDMKEKELISKEDYLSTFPDNLTEILIKKKEELNNKKKLKENIEIEVSELRNKLDAYQYKAEKNSLIKRIELKKLRLNSLIEDIAKLGSSSDSLKEEINKNRQILDKKRENYNFFLLEQQQIKRKMDSLLEKVKKIESLSEVCPYCLQIIPEEKKKVVLSELNKEFNLEKEKFDNLTEKIKTLNEEIVFLSSGITDLELKMNKISVMEITKNVLEEELNSLIKDCVEKYNNIEYEVIKNDEMDEINQSIQNKEKLLSEINDICFNLNKEIGIFEEKISQFKGITKEIEILKTNLNEKKNILNHLKYLEHLLSNKGIRNEILDLVIPFINNEVNSYLNDIFPLVQVNFLTSIKGKTVDVKKELTLEITDLLTKNSRTFKYWSGGEKMLISLAIRLALWKMIYQFSEKKFEILFLDEIFSCLDENYRDNVFNFLQKKQKEWNVPIIIIEHLPEIKEKFEQRIYVSKDENSGSVLVIQ